jgi:hypothetical protein
MTPSTAVATTVGTVTDNDFIKWRASYGSEYRCNANHHWTVSIDSEGY